MAFLEPLKLGNEVTLNCSEVVSKCDEVECLLCPLSHNVSGDVNGYLKHLLVEHQLVIADVNLVSDLPKYLQHWKRRFAEGNLVDFCPVIRTNPQAEGEAKDYYLLCDLLPEDRELRVSLQQEKLKRVLEHYEAERSDESFHRECLFCRSTFRARNELLDHMTFQHNFSIGHPDNLVYLTEFLDVLADKLAKLNCFFCEKTFKDRLVLKEHMRKKQHKRLNPQNKSYDKYYLVNYLEFGKNWEDIQSEPDEDDEIGRKIRSEDGGELARDELIGRDEEWGDWTGSNVSLDIFCLVCRESRQSLEEVREHMRCHGGFDFEAATENMDFYDRVKLVNYFRRMVHGNQCPGCEQEFPTWEELQVHLKDDVHWQKPEKALWNRPEYFFPTYEDDNLLCFLDDASDDDEHFTGDGRHFASEQHWSNAS